MKITEAIIKKLMEIIDGGLCQGAGRMTSQGTFCVQQAVTAATRIGHSDHPECVNGYIRSLGVFMNDRLGVECEKSERSRILRRFAVAELGSNTLNETEIRKRILEKWNKTYPKRNVYLAEDIGNSGNVEDVAEVAVQTLIDMKSPGTEYLYMCGDTRPGDPHPSEDTKEKHQIEKEVVDLVQKRLQAPAQLSWRTKAKGHHCASKKEIK